MRMATMCALLVALGSGVGVARAADPCDDIFMTGPEDSKETDGFEYTGNQSKTLIPEGVLPASRAAVIAAGLSEAYFDANVTLHSAEVDYEMPGCATWLSARVGWTHHAGEWEVSVVTELTNDGAPVVATVSPAAPRELGALPGKDEAAAAIADCGAPMGELRASYCAGSEHLCVSIEVDTGGKQGHATLDLETLGLDCIEDATTIGGTGAEGDGTVPPGDDGDKASPGAADKGQGAAAGSSDPDTGRTETGCTAAPGGQGPLAGLLLAALLVLGRRRRAARG